MLMFGVPMKGLTNITKHQPRLPYPPILNTYSGLNTVLMYIFFHLLYPSQVSNSAKEEVLLQFPLQTPPFWMGFHCPPNSTCTAPFPFELPCSFPGPDLLSPTHNPNSYSGKPFHFPPLLRALALMKPAAWTTPLLIRAPLLHMHTSRLSSFQIPRRQG